MRPAPTTSGLFITLDGLDGTGKSTQCRLLADWLSDAGCTVTRCVDPGGTPAGDRLRDLIFHSEQPLSINCEALLFMASRAQLVAEVIRPALSAGHVVVSDRFLLANVVYQGHAGGLDPRELWRIGLFSTGGVEPDLTLVLDLDPADAQTRRGRPADRIERRDDGYHARVRDGFLAEAARRPERVRVIDASGSVDAVQQQVRGEVTRLLGQR
jgi:dTMP kinase